jgi:predicted neuraminidase
MAVPLKLQSGKLLLVDNDSINRRSPLTVALSPDNNKTWPHNRNIAVSPDGYAYPSAFEARDGTIHVVCTTDRRTVINHAVADEEWVISGKLGGRALQKR